MVPSTLGDRNRNPLTIAGTIKSANHWPIKLRLINIGRMEARHLVKRRFEESPRIAREVNRTREGHGAGRVDAAGVQQFNPDVDVTVGFAECSVGIVQGTGRVVTRIETEQAHHGGLPPPQGAIGLRPKLLADVLRPMANIHAVRAEQGQSDAFQAESHAGTIGDGSVMQLNSER
jgi:hypothetical protein